MVEKTPIHNTPKAAGTNSPIREGLFFECAHHRFGKRMPLEIQISHADDRVPSSREMVRCFLSALAPAAPKKAPKLSADLERLNRVLRSILTAVEEEVLTQDEADAVIGFIADRFMHRRLDEVVDKVTEPKSGSWFLVHGQIREER